MKWFIYYVVKHITSWMPSQTVEVTDKWVVKWLKFLHYGQPGFKHDRDSGWVTPFVVGYSPQHLESKVKQDEFLKNILPPNFMTALLH